MPHIRVRGTSLSDFERFSQNLETELAPLMQTPSDNFTTELIPSQFYISGKSATPYPFIEILWFERSQEIKTLTAQFMTTKLKNICGASTDIAVVFFPIEKTDYFENGKHF